ncbi:MAG: hypothetical protein RR933_08205, partial [Oscillospiraceae bacterium]
TLADDDDLIAALVKRADNIVVNCFNNFHAGKRLLPDTAVDLTSCTTYAGRTKRLNIKKPNSEQVTEKTDPSKFGFACITSNNPFDFLLCL